MKIFKKVSAGLLSLAVIAVFSNFPKPLTAQAATTPNLGTAGAYGVLSETFTANVGQTTITGSLGYTNLSGSGTVLVNGATNTPAPGQADTDAGLALANLNAQTCVSLGTNVVLAGTYTPGCYFSTGTMDIVLGTTVILNGAGTYIFRAGGAITTGANSIVALANGASSCDVFWTPDGGTTLGANSTFIGTVMPVAQDITVGNLTSWTGRALTYGHTVTADTATINSTCMTAAITPPSINNNTITVFKQVINDNSGTAVFTDFSLFINGNRVNSGQSVSLPPGPYTITETNLPGYARTFTGNCDANGLVNHGGVDTHNDICTVVNNDIGIAAIPVVPPLIDVVKVPSPLSLPSGSGSVMYTYTLRNIGTVPVTNITMLGDTCSPIVRVSGDTDGDAALDLNETWVHTCTTTLSATHTNTVVATGQANGLTAVDVASATVVVGSPIIPPLIHITKVPYPLTLPAGTGWVTYTKTVTNPGTVALSNVSVSDDKCSPVNYISGDSDGDALLDTTEAWIYTCQSQLTQTTTNTAIATGSANGLIATDFALATVVVAVPRLPNTGFDPNR